MQGAKYIKWGAVPVAAIGLARLLVACNVGVGIASMLVCICGLGVLPAEICMFAGITCMSASLGMACATDVLSRRIPLPILRSLHICAFGISASMLVVSGAAESLMMTQVSNEDLFFQAFGNLGNLEEQTRFQAFDATGLQMLIRACIRSGLGVAAMLLLALTGVALSGLLIRLRHRNSVSKFSSIEKASSNKTTTGKLFFNKTAAGNPFPNTDTFNPIPNSSTHSSSNSPQISSPLGGGDIRLMTVLGAVLGLEALLALLIASVLAIAYCVIYRQNTVPFGPCLAIPGLLLALVQAILIF